MVRHIFGVVVLIVFISGCSSPTNSGSGIANYPISNTDITVSGTVQVQTPANSGNAIFSVVCQLAYINQSGADSVFNSASISVNGMHLVHQYTDGTFYGSGFIFRPGYCGVHIQTSDNWNHCADVTRSTIHNGLYFAASGSI